MEQLESEKPIPQLFGALKSHFLWSVNLSHIGCSEQLNKTHYFGNTFPLYSHAFVYFSGDITNALADLNTAIELSGGRGTAASQAYTQQGLLLRLEGKEEAALEAFHKAAALGNAFAKTMVVQLNPYAALCNAMLAEAIDKLQQGETS